MENASKAFIMAAGVLIGILIISFMMLLLRKGGQMSSEFDSQLSNNELLKFNSQFELYQRSDIENTFFDVITVVNLAYDVNTSAQWQPESGVTVVVKEGVNEKYRISDSMKIPKHTMLDNSDHEKDIYSEIIGKYTKLKNDDPAQGYQYQFVCEKIDYNTASGKVNQVIFRAEER